MQSVIFGAGTNYSAKEEYKESTNPYLLHVFYKMVAERGILHWETVILSVKSWGYWYSSFYSTWLWPSYGEDLKNRGISYNKCNIWLFIVVLGSAMTFHFFLFLRLHQYRNHRIHRCTNIKHTVSLQRKTWAVGQSGKQVSTLPALSLKEKKMSQRKSERNL